MEPDQGRRMWFFIDELPVYGKVSQLENLARQGRKFGASIVVGYQADSQLRVIYGKDGADSLKACFRNRLYLSTSDFETASAISRDIGQQEIERRNVSVSESDKTTTSTSHQITKSEIALPSEIQNLPARTGYLVLAGDFPVAHVHLDIPQLGDVAKPFELKS
jgi:type IV secretory pathway TraG/TraD family ATPase VirD4